MPIDTIIQEAKGMTDDSLMEVVHFMQYLKIAPLRKNMVMTSSAGSAGQKNIYRTPGLYEGQIKISEEFDEPLDDFKEYM